MTKKGLMQHIDQHLHFPVLLGGYIALIIFFLAFLFFDKNNWLALSNPREPIAFLLAGLLIAPLVAAFLWDRITSIKIGDLEIGLEQSEKKVSKTPFENLPPASRSYDSAEVVHFVKTALIDAQNTKLLQIDLGTGYTWTAVYLYLLIALLEDFTSTEQLFFVNSLAGVSIRFLGIVKPMTLRQALAKFYPQLEDKYRRLYGSITRDAEGLLRKEELTTRGEITLQVGQTVVNYVVELLIQQFLAAFADEQVQHPVWITESKLKDLLGHDLVLNTILPTRKLSARNLVTEIVRQTNQEVQFAPLNSSTRFFVLVDGTQLIVVDVLELAARVTGTLLQTK